MLYHLEKMRAIQWDRLWTDVAKRTAVVYGATRLGDQDIVNAVIKQNPNLVYRVPCEWNTQLSDHTNSHRCYVDREIKVKHRRGKVAANFSLKKVSVIAGNFTKS